VAARHPHVPMRILTGNVRFTHNPKVSNLAPAISTAAHDLILVKDSNVELGPRQLRDLVANFTAGIGMVCAVPLAVRPLSFAAEIECAMLNGHFAPILLAASAVSVDVGFGKVMLFDRRAFERVDGIKVMANTFGDDQALAKAFGRAGLRTVFSEAPVVQAMEDRSAREVWDRQLRWMLIRRAEAPAIFVIEPFIGMAVAAAAGAAAAAIVGWPWWALPAATIALWLIAESAVVLTKGWHWSWRYPLASLSRELLVPALWLRAWTARSVRWADIRHDLPKADAGS
jgi:ceramide glucosyltransferase